MTDQQLETAIKEVIDSNHEPNPTLENRVIAAMPWNAPAPSTAKTTWSTPRLAGAFVALIASALVVVLVASTVMNRLLPAGVTGEPPAYSVGAMTGDSIFIVQRNLGNLGSRPAPDANFLLQSTDDGRTWVNRAHFSGVYGGMQIFGDAGFVWSLDMQLRNCTSNGCQPMTQAMTLYRTTDGGATWTPAADTPFPVQDAYFFDGTHGWAVSPEDGPVNGLALYATSDAGTTWSRVGPLPGQAPNGYVYGVGNHPVTFTSDTDGKLRGWYVGASRLYTTSDGGHTWEAVKFPVPPAVAGFTVAPSQPTIDDRGGVVAIAYRDPKGADNATANHIYLYVSTDGGATWTDPRPAPAGFAPVGDDFSVATLDSSHLWLTSLSPSAGDNVQAPPAVAVTMNAGKQWQVYSHTPRILEMIFLDPLRGVGLAVTGPNNTNEIVRTEDSGKTWQVLNVPVFSK